MRPSRRAPPFRTHPMERSEVAGFLEVGRTEDTHEVVIIHPNLKLDMNGRARIVF
jgi:hypothetical protein